MMATAEAHPNIALIKYWGKRDERLKLPFNSSLSVTLAPLRTRTAVCFEQTLEQDEVVANGTRADTRFVARVSAFLDLFRGLAGTSLRARVETDNDFPTAAGLASSASGFAALACAAADALSLRLSLEALSVLARQGSGSACRSLQGGFVEWRKGDADDGSDSFGVQLAPVQHWDLRILVVVVEGAAKPLSSREAMKRTVQTSPFYPGWLSRVQRDLDHAREAVLARSLTELGPIVEQNAMAMFGTMLGAEPPILYWQPATIAVMRAVQAVRAEGIEAYYTLDAGPNPKVLCLGPKVAGILEVLRRVPGVERVISTTVGGPARGIQ